MDPIEFSTQAVKAKRMKFTEFHEIVSVLCGRPVQYQRLYQAARGLGNLHDDERNAVSVALSHSWTKKWVSEDGSKEVAINV